MKVLEIKTNSIKVSGTNGGLDRFNFYVVYWHTVKRRRKFTTVKAKDFDSAISKLYKNFKSIIEIEEA